MYHLLSYHQVWSGCFADLPQFEPSIKITTCLWTEMAGSDLIPRGVWRVWYLGWWLLESICVLADTIGCLLLDWATDISPWNGKEMCSEYPLVEWLWFRLMSLLISSEMFSTIPSPITASPPQDVLLHSHSHYLFNLLKRLGQGSVL